MLSTVFIVTISLLSFLLPFGHAAPTENYLQKRQLLDVTSAIGSLFAGATGSGATQNTFNSILTQLMKIKPTTSPTSIQRKMNNIPLDRSLAKPPNRSEVNCVWDRF